MKMKKKMKKLILLGMVLSLSSSQIFPMFKGFRNSHSEEMTKMYKDPTYVPPQYRQPKPGYISRLKNWAKNKGASLIKKYQSLPKDKKYTDKELNQFVATLDKKAKKLPNTPRYKKAKALIANLSRRGVTGANKIIVGTVKWAWNNKITIAGTTLFIAIAILLIWVLSDINIIGVAGQIVKAPKAGAEFIGNTLNVKWYINFFQKGVFNVDRVRAIKDIALGKIGDIQEFMKTGAQYLTLEEIKDLLTEVGKRGADFYNKVEDMVRIYRPDGMAHWKGHLHKIV